MAPEAISRAIPRPSREGHRARLYGRLLGRAHARAIPLRGLRQSTLQQRHEVRFRHRLAQLQQSDQWRERRRGDGSVLVHEPHRGALLGLRRPSGTRFSGRAPAHGAALLHQLCVADAGARSRADGTGLAPPPTWAISTKRQSALASRIWKGVCTRTLRTSGDPTITASHLPREVATLSRLSE